MTRMCCSNGSIFDGNGSVDKTKVGIGIVHVYYELSIVQDFWKRHAKSIIFALASFDNDVLLSICFSPFLDK